MVGAEVTGLTVRHDRLATVRNLAGPATLWALASVAVFGLAYKRYHAALAGPVGGDFRYYLSAARAVAGGHSPYDVAGYVYPPVIALVLAPVSHLDTQTVWRLWAAALSAAFIGAAILVVFTLAPHLSPRQRPVLFGIAGTTALHFWPTTVIFFLGQADPVVLVLLAAVVVATEKGRSKTAGVMLGLVGLVKGWPAAAVISVFRRGYERRLATVLAFAVTLVLAPVLTVAMGGVSELSQFSRSVFDARSQHLISNSVWGIPTLNFSPTGLAVPVVASAALRVFVTVVLVAWVAGLVVITLRGPGTGFAGNVGFWNLALCIVLLLPVSHLAYAIIGLPILWCWTGTLMTQWRWRRDDGRTWQRSDTIVVAVTTVLVLWWIVLNRSWPDNGSSATISSLRYSVVFVADLLACSASVLATRLLAGDRHPVPGRAAG